MKCLFTLLVLTVVVGLLFSFTPAVAQDSLATSETSITTDQLVQPQEFPTTWGRIKDLYRMKDTSERTERGLETQSICPGMCTMRFKFPFCGSWSITRKYGTVTHVGQDYYAIDWSLPGETDFNQPVLAPASGTIVWSGLYGDYGNQVIVDVGNGMLYRVAHLNWLRFPNARRYVYQGQTLGGCGHTGNSDGSHIHFAVYANSAYAGGGRISGQSVPQEGISGQFVLIKGSYYPSYQTCMSW